MKIDCELDSSVVQRKLGLLKVIQDAARQSLTWNQWLPDEDRFQWVSVKENGPQGTVSVHIPPEKARLLRVDYELHNERASDKRFLWNTDEQGAMNLVFPKGDSAYFPTVEFVPRGLATDLPRWGEETLWAEAPEFPLLRLRSSKTWFAPE